MTYSTFASSHAMQTLASQATKVQNGTCHSRPQSFLSFISSHITVQPLLTCFFCHAHLNATASCPMPKQHVFGMAHMLGPFIHLLSSFSVEMTKIPDII